MTPLRVPARPHRHPIEMPDDYSGPLFIEEVEWDENVAFGD